MNYSNLEKTDAGVMSIELANFFFTDLQTMKLANIFILLACYISRKIIKDMNDTKIIVNYFLVNYTIWKLHRCWRCRVDLDFSNLDENCDTKEQEKDCVKWLSTSKTIILYL